MAAIQADTKRLVNAVVNGVDNFKVDLTARNDGPQGNEIEVSYSYYEDESSRGRWFNNNSTSGGLLAPMLMTYGRLLEIPSLF